MYAWLAAQAPRLTERFDQDGLRAHRRATDGRAPGDRPRRDRGPARLPARAAGGWTTTPALADAAVALFREHRNRVEPYADAARRCAAARALRLVAVTNGNAEVQETPLAACFDHAITAADAGAAKPDPAMFERPWLGRRPPGAGPAHRRRSRCSTARRRGASASPRSGSTAPARLARRAAAAAAGGDRPARAAGLARWAGAPGWPRGKRGRRCALTLLARDGPPAAAG
jgi:hypothetical protein